MISRDVKIIINFYTIPAYSGENSGIEIKEAAQYHNTESINLYDPLYMENKDSNGNTIGYTYIDDEDIINITGWEEFTSNPTGML